MGGLSSIQFLFLFFLFFLFCRAPKLNIVRPHLQIQKHDRAQGREDEECVEKRVYIASKTTSSTSQLRARTIAKGVDEASHCERSLNNMKTMANKNQ